MDAFAKTVRAADAASGRIVSSGLTIPYKCSYHNRHDESGCVESDGEAGDSESKTARRNSQAR